MPDFSIESKQGTITDGVDGFIFEDIEGFGLPPEVLSFTSSPAEGGHYISGRTGMRDGTFFIGVDADSEANLQEKITFLSRVIDRSAEPDLLAVMGGETYRIPFYRTGGGSTLRKYSGIYERFEIEVRCPNPFWVRDEPVNLDPVGRSADARGLLPDLAELPLSPSDAQGSFTLENPGDVPAPMSWRFTGPFETAEVVLGGRGFTITKPLGEGEVITVFKTPTGWVVEDQDGKNVYSLLGPAPKFPLVPVGKVQGVAKLGNAGAEANVTGWFNPMLKVIR